MIYIGRVGKIMESSSSVFSRSQGVSGSIGSSTMLHPGRRRCYIRLVVVISSLSSMLYPVRRRNFIRVVDDDKSRSSTMLHPVRRRFYILLVDVLYPVRRRCYIQLTLFHLVVEVSTGSSMKINPSLRRSHIQHVDVTSSNVQSYHSLTRIDIS